jgi:hypothetical protein
MENVVVESVIVSFFVGGILGGVLAFHMGTAFIGRK